MNKLIIVKENKVLVKQAMFVLFVMKEDQMLYLWNVVMVEHAFNVLQIYKNKKVNVIYVER